MSTAISRLYNWATDKVNGVKILAARLDAENDQIITALNRKTLCSGSAPGSPIAGQTWVDTTNKVLKQYRNNEWVIIGIVHVSDTAPSTTQKGDVWIDTTGSEIVFKVRNKDNDAWDTVPTSVGAGCLGSFKNLKVVYSSATTVTVTADELHLEDANNVKQIIRSVNESIAITTSGASGLDTGSEGSSRWYYIWIIRKSSDGTVNGLLSESSTSPNLPSGYDQFALVSAVRNDGSSNFVSFTQYGRKYCYTTWQTMASGNAGLGSWTSVDTTAFVPSALSVFAFGYASDNANPIAVTNINSAPVASGTTVGQVVRGGDDIYLHSFRWELDILTANTLYWASNGASAVLYIHGFEITSLT